MPSVKPPGADRAPRGARVRRVRRQRDGRSAGVRRLLLGFRVVYLTFFFHPSPTEVVYQGSYAPMRGVRVSEAYQSALDLSFGAAYRVRGGSIRFA